MVRICDFPEDVVEEFMSWLPPESLKQFKCVNKKYYTFINALIKNPDFVAKHLENMKKKMASSRFLHFRNLMAFNPAEIEQAGNLVEANYLLTLADDEKCIPCVTEDLLLPLFSRRLLRHNLLAGQCNGIICFALLIFNDVIFLLNPALREIKTLPASCLGDEYKLREVGFGYDSAKNDYKVVTIRADDDLGGCKAEVYSLSTNSWKEINFDVEVCEVLCRYPPVYYNGVCCWCYLDEVCAINSFDFGDDVFHSTPLPDNVKRAAQEGGELGQTNFLLWKESLVLLFFRGNDSMVIDMWMMNSNSGVAGDVQGSSCYWTKYLTIGPLVGIQRPLKFWGNVLYLRSNHGKVIYYDLYTNDLVDYSVHIGMSENACLLIELKSLVSVLKTAERI